MRQPPDAKRPGTQNPRTVPHSFALRSDQQTGITDDTARVRPAEDFAWQLAEGARWNDAFAVSAMSALDGRADPVDVIHEILALSGRVGERLTFALVVGVA